MMWRVRTCMPRPHEAEHELQAFHGDITQSTGQSTALHRDVCVPTPQSLPPNAG